MNPVQLDPLVRNDPIAYAFASEGKVCEIIPDLKESAAVLRAAIRVLGQLWRLDSLDLDTRLDIRAALSLLEKLSGTIRQHTVE